MLRANPPPLTIGSRSRRPDASGTATMSEGSGPASLGANARSTVQGRTVGLNTADCPQGVSHEN